MIGNMFRTYDETKLQELENKKYRVEIFSSNNEKYNKGKHYPVVVIRVYEKGLFSRIKKPIDNVVAKNSPYQLILKLDDETRKPKLDGKMLYLSFDSYGSPGLGETVSTRVDDKTDLESLLKGK